MKAPEVLSLVGMILSKMKISPSYILFKDKNDEKAGIRFGLILKEAPEDVDILRAELNETFLGYGLHIVKLEQKAQMKPIYVSGELLCI